MGTNRLAKMQSLGAHVRNARQYVHEGDPNVVAWPLTGWWEMPLWRHRTHRTFIAMHDPEAVARQDGLTPLAAANAIRFSGSRWPHLVTMSPEAYTAAAKHIDSDRIHLVPHPMRAPQLGPDRTPRKSILVLGQYKPARDLDVMAVIAPALRAAGWTPIVAGRGWPAVPGWDVVDRFVSEAEFAELIGSAATVLLPYRHYFQSGVALRALEAGVPVVGRSTGFLTLILGANFAGAVENWDDAESWVSAVIAATSLREDQLHAATDYSARAADAWRDLLSRTGHRLTP
ncbi:MULTISPECIES: glycosyltransferase [unclassified Mycolicibacterium]|uniref:glycosyltransferase n=1 Tax=unclassified Mycolicibacterium TaxID=2636767 RepID=UPI0012DEEDC5|nr:MULTISPECIES: glycosyltransferase [unclassified Mycolicibacterium]MUL59322.1 glycosyltransferase [Mycolicibacterium sp. CBMA 335]